MFFQVRQELKSKSVNTKTSGGMVSVLQASMKSELSQGSSSNQKKSDCYNIVNIPCTPAHLRWPNELCPARVTKRRTDFDDVSLDQFVVGFLKCSRDTES